MSVDEAKEREFFASLRSLSSEAVAEVLPEYYWAVDAAGLARYTDSNSEMAKKLHDAWRILLCGSASRLSRVTFFDMFFHHFRDLLDFLNAPMPWDALQYPLVSETTPVHVALRYANDLAETWPRESLRTAAKWFPTLCKRAIDGVGDEALWHCAIKLSSAGDPEVIAQWLVDAVKRSSSPRRHAFFGNSPEGLIKSPLLDYLAKNLDRGDALFLLNLARRRGSIVARIDSLGEARLSLESIPVSLAGETSAVGPSWIPPALELVLHEALAAACQAVVARYGRDEPLVTERLAAEMEAELLKRQLALQNVLLQTAGGRRLYLSVQHYSLQGKKGVERMTGGDLAILFNADVEGRISRHRFTIFQAKKQSGATSWLLNRMAIQQMERLIVFTRSAYHIFYLGSKKDGLPPVVLPTDFLRDLVRGRKTKSIPFREIASLGMPLADYLVFSLFAGWSGDEWSARGNAIDYIIHTVSPDRLLEITIGSASQGYEGEAGEGRSPRIDGRGREEK